MAYILILFEGTAWLSVIDVAKAIGSSPNAVLKLTATTLFDPGRFNLGLMMRIPAHHKQTLGFTRKTTAGWEFSNDALATIQDYRTEFPQIWNVVAAEPEKKRYPLASMLPSGGLNVIAKLSQVGFLPEFF